MLGATQHGKKYLAPEEYWTVLFEKLAEAHGAKGYQGVVVQNSSQGQSSCGMSPLQLENAHIAQTYNVHLAVGQLTDSLTVEAHKDLRCLARCARPAFPLDDDSDSPPVHDLETLEQKTDRHESERDFLREAMNKLGFTSVHGWNFKLPVVAQLAQMSIWSVHV